ncbi:surface-adhesin E family protein [Variovorax sp. Root411]|uniref:surface-adhesin E family protein n=1 Tax=Variovorax sp. Root411 TaxID=1736530 RepID=UPI0039E159B4
MIDSKSLAFAIGLFFVFAGAGAQAADWRRVGQRDAAGTTFYLDVDSPRRDVDGKIVATVLLDFSTERRAPDARTYMSSTRVVRFDCGAERLADQAIIFYAEPRGGGAVVRRMERSAEQANADLESTDSQSSGKALAYAACEVYARGKPSSGK